jgi:hypothetical protein
MIWDVAAGIIIGGGAVGLVWSGISLTAEAALKGDDSVGCWPLLLSVAGLALGVWVLIFKAHY